MAKPRREQEGKEPLPPTRRVLPMQLQIGNRLTDETGEWEVIARPYTTAGGKTARVLFSGSASLRLPIYGRGLRTSASA